MRYATVVVRWEDAELLPLNSAIAAEPDLDTELIYYLNPLPEGSYVELSRFRGDMDRARELFAASPAVRRFRAPAETDGIVYLQYDSAPVLDELMASLASNAVVISWPVRFTADSLGVEMTLVGTSSALQGSFEAYPDALDVQLRKTGDYVEMVTGPLDALTDRQREILAVATRRGYYQYPRATTQRELARELDIAPGTVAEQLRRIEATLMGTLTGPQ